MVTPPKTQNLVTISKMQLIIFRGSFSIYNEKKIILANNISKPILAKNKVWKKFQFLTKTMD